MIKSAAEFSAGFRCDSAPIPRSPSASTAALVGGGEPVSPGESRRPAASFLDEFEFRHDAIGRFTRRLSQDRRVAGSIGILPAAPLVVAALNPCPCGFHGDPRACCSPRELDRYRNRLSGRFSTL